MRRFLRWINAPLVLTFALSVTASLALWFYLWWNPRDWVEVTITNIPADAVLIGVVSEHNGLPEEMNCYFAKVGPFTMSPERFGPIENKGRPKAWDYRHAVQWRFGERYGVVTTGAGQARSVTWFDAADVPLRGRNFVTGGGEVVFDLSKGVIEPWRP